MKKALQRLVCTALSLIMVFSLSLNSFAAGIDLGNQNQSAKTAISRINAVISDISTTNLVSKAQLLRENVLLHNGDKVSLTNVLVLRYSLRDLIPKDEAALIDGKSYLITLPTYINCDKSLNQNINIDSETLLGNVTYYDSNGADGAIRIKLTFAAADTLGDEEISNIYFEFASTLDENQIAGRQIISVPLEGSGTGLELKVTDNDITDPSITAKSGEYSNETGLITWSINIKKEVAEFADGSLKYTLGYVLKDKLGDTQTYVPGTFQIKTGNNEATTIPDSSLNLPDETNENTLGVTLTQAFNDDTVITYKTKPDSSVLKNGQLLSTKAVTVNNTAELYKPNGSDLISSITGTADITPQNWLVKKGISYDLKNNTATWQLTVHTNGVPFKSISVYDIIGSQSSFNSTSANLSVTADGSAIAAGDTANTYTANTSFDGRSDSAKEAQKLLVLNNPTKSTYTITYTTTINDDLTHNMNLRLENKAWLEYDWDFGNDGPGEGDQFTIPTIDAPYSISARMVEKSGAYNPATGIITWTVTLNKNHRNIQNAVIGDTYNNTNQTYFEGSFDGTDYKPHITQINGVATGDGSPYSISMSPADVNSGTDSTSYKVNIKTIQPMLHGETPTQ